jgi:hypothetical protein
MAVEQGERLIPSCRCPLLETQRLFTDEGIHARRCFPGQKRPHTLELVIVGNCAMETDI